MNGIARAGATLLGAAAAGVLLWLAAQIGRDSTGGYWAAYGVVAAAGLIFAVAQLRGRNGNPPAMLALAFLPVLVVGGWVLLALQPEGNWFKDHVLSWSGDIGILDVVQDVGTWIGVIAFGIGYTLGAALEPTPRRTEVVAPAAYDRTAADEPLTAERRETERREAAQRAVAQREAAQRETAQRETAQRETAQREAEHRDAARLEPRRETVEPEATEPAPVERTNEPVTR
jgi:hypothetical protein